MFLAVQELERRRIRFDEIFVPGSLPLSDRNWNQQGEFRAVGSAELLDRSGSRTIRVRGHIRGAVSCTCARCLELVSTQLDGDFDLFYYPMALIARNEEIPLDRQDTDIGFYQGRGLELREVVEEQIMLWLPMRTLCKDNCKGLCPRCGANLNQGACDCRESFEDPRWDALRKLQGKWKT